MKASFRKFSLFAGILSVLFVAGGLLCAGAVKTALVVDCSRTFYFLVSEAQNADAAAEAGALGGGAGYVMEREGREYAVLSCYFSLSDAQSVRDRLSESDVRASVRGMPIPSREKAFFSACKVAAVSARRKFFVLSSSAPRILQSK